jgi:glycosyltransferase involved in cell wall biosynthesis
MNSALLIIEPHGSGHHAIYVERMVEAAMATGRRVILGTTPSFQSDYLSGRRLGGVLRPEDLLLCDWRGPADVGFGAWSLIKKEWAYWDYFRRVFRAACQRVEVGEVFIPYFDYLIHAMALRGSPFDGVPVSGVAMRVNFHFAEAGVLAPPQRLSGVKERLFKRFLSNSNLKHVYCIDPSLKAYAQQKFSGELGQKVAYLPDPVDPPVRGACPVVTRSAMGLPEAGKILLVYGSIEPRKGLSWLLQGLGQGGLDEWTVVVAGAQVDSSTAMLRQDEAQTMVNAGKLILLNRRISDEEEQQLFAASDAVWVNYVEFYQMSGVFVKAAVYGRPAIVNKAGVLGYIAPKYRKSILLEDGAQWVHALEAWFKQPDLSATAMLDSDDAFRREHYWESASRQLFGGGK